MLRRSSAAYELASSGLLDPATSLLLADAVRRAREVGQAERDLAESDLTQALRAVFGQPGFRKELEDMDGGPELISEVEAAAQQVFIARKFYNDLAARTICAGAGRWPGCSGWRAAPRVPSSSRSTTRCPTATAPASPIRLLAARIGWPEARPYQEVLTVASETVVPAEKETGTARVKRGMAEMLKGGVIMDVVTPEQAKIAEDAGAVAVMALERVPADIRAQGGVARDVRPGLIHGIMNAVSIPVMAKCRIGHFVEAQVLEAIGVDYIDESEVLTPADEAEPRRQVQFQGAVRVRLPQSGRGAAPDRRRRRDDPHQGRGRHRQRGRGRPAHARTILGEIAGWPDCR